MCSIFAALLCNGALSQHREVVVRESQKLAHRGPDSAGLSIIGRSILAHNRIAVVDVFTGGQPIHGPNKSAVIANAEIYNHIALRQEFSSYSYTTGSDCEVIIPAVTTLGAAGITKLRGMFAFVCCYDDGRRYYIARDRVGILSLYYGFGSDGTLYVASELKALTDICTEFFIFPPGHYMTEADKEPRPYFDLRSELTSTSNSFHASPTELRDRLTESVQAHLMADVDVGFLLSGGLDSSLIASIGTRILTERGVRKPRSYSIGLADSPDLAAAREVAAFIGTDHFEYVYTLEEGIDAIEQTIYHLESYDVTSVRASVPMLLLSRRIRGRGTKVVLTGDGADELFAGYLYFYYAPDGTALHEELIRKLTSMHFYDCLRANKTMLGWGVEPRVPFLDNEFLSYAMALDPELKRPTTTHMEKYLLRSAFEGYLPDSVLWRQKEQSSDGVGYSWIDGLKAHCEEKISDDMLIHANQIYPFHTPRTKEAYFYRSLFERRFSHRSAENCSPDGKSSGNATSAARQWLDSTALDDPSGRALQAIHVSTRTRAGL